MFKSRKLAWVLLVIFGAAVFISLNWNFKEKTKTAIVWNSVSLKHDLSGQPESSQRIDHIIKLLKSQKIWATVNTIEARPATEEELALVHDKKYIQYVKDWATKQDAKFQYHEKWSAYNSPYAYQSALTAVGGVIQLSEAVAQKQYQNGFAIIRPPGHHALKGHGMGYCIFNNIAIAAANLLSKNMAHKILIVDIDAHHGNGIEDSFKNSSQVAYVSFHQKWIFPYTGQDKFSNIHNKQLNFLEPEENYKTAFDTALAAVLTEFKPDFIFVSAGYDAHWRDYMSNLGLSLNGYSWIAERLVSYADQYSEGKIVFSLEGGYDLEALSYGVSNSIKALMKRNDFLDPIGSAPKN